MKNQLSYSLVVFIIFFIGCTTHDITHDTSQLEEAGKWVNIKSAPLTSNYILRGNRIYGVGFNVPLDSIDWNLFWDEFLMPRSALSTSEEFGKTSREWVRRDSSTYSIKHVDIETFEVNLNTGNDLWSQLYAKDKRYVYYPTHISIECNNAYYDITFEGDIRIPGADPKSFKYLGKGFAVDEKNMYYRGEKIKWNDHIITALQQEDCPEFLPIDYGMPKDD